MNTAPPEIHTIAVFGGSGATDRWHLAQILPRLRLGRNETQQVVNILMAYFDDSSSIVKTNAMQALADLARQTPELRPSILIH